MRLANVATTCEQPGKPGAAPFVDQSYLTSARNGYICQVYTQTERVDAHDTQFPCSRGAWCSL